VHFIVEDAEISFGICSKSLRSVQGKSKGKLAAIIFPELSVGICQAGKRLGGCLGGGTLRATLFGDRFSLLELKANFAAVELEES
jgi:hypothetical protein